jgi:hypothetical protein
VASYPSNTKITIPMNPKSTFCPASLKRPSNGGDYVAEGMSDQQQSVAGALTPAA